MRAIVLIILIFTAEKLNATPELEHFTCKGKNITIDVIYRYRNSIQQLYYASLTKSLDKYVGSLKAQGKLNRGKIHFEIMTGEWMDEATGIKMYRHKKGYYCWLNGLSQEISREYLAKIITYFSQGSWESFCYNDSLIAPQTALNIFNKRLDSIPSPKKLEGEKLIDLNTIGLYYLHDSLICKSSKLNYGQISYLLPFAHRKRDFITCGNTIFVIGDNGVINKTTLTDDDFTGESYDPPWVEVFSKWINFKNMDGYFLSYSFEENKFYKL